MHRKKSYFTGEFCDVVAAVVAAVVVVVIVIFVSFTFAEHTMSAKKELIRKIINSRSQFNTCM